MVTSCCAYGCSQRFVKGSSITFHCFPKDPIRYKQWAIAIRREGFIPSRHTRICSKHFTEDSFDRRKLGGSWLKDDAIPTLFNFRSRPIKSVMLGRPLQKCSSTEKISPSFVTKKACVSTNVEITEDSTIQNFNKEIKVDSHSSDDLEDTPTAPSNFKIIDDFAVCSTENEEIQVYRLSSDSDSEDVVIPDCDMDIEDAQILQPNKKKERHFYRYPGDFKHSTISPSNINKRFWEIALKQIERQRRVIRLLHQKNRRLTKKNTSMKIMLDEWRKQSFLANAFQSSSEEE